ncbi:replication protein A 32 kDa subunit [Microdochium trichocladiopsis]|uniref:Replication protein A 32 kDa subunit n=1 Tax=Microdochium trichocladiopsis TaxID=1682393 RepID=A0A9P8Y6H1_9PEZI|nr:replication protein A 32 kDa subunit [Microdochium trichocladiopsis]KAH7030808.1 replication protein A 32 kDa subunit [Microdochium trichocladiopsis]
MYGGSQGGSQGGQKNFADESLRPVTIKQIIDAEQGAPEDPFRIDGQEVTQVTFVGMVRSISPQTTNITYKIDDGTGIIEVKQWLDSDKQDEASSKADIPLDSYVRVWGRVRNFNRRHVGAHVIKPVQDFNEVNYHLLEATYVHLFFTKGGLPSAGGANGSGGDSMFVDNDSYGNSGGNASLAGMSANARKMFQWLQNAEGGNEGVNLHMIAQGARMSVPDVMAASEELIGPGLIYTTVDDETFAILSY